MDPFYEDRGYCGGRGLGYGGGFGNSLAVGDPRYDRGEVYEGWSLPYSYSYQVPYLGWQYQPGYTGYDLANRQGFGLPFERYSSIYGGLDDYYNTYAVSLRHASRAHEAIYALGELPGGPTAGREIGAAAAYQGYLLWDRERWAGSGMWRSGMRGGEGLVSLAMGEAFNTYTRISAAVSGFVDEVGREECIRTAAATARLLNDETYRGNDFYEGGVEYGRELGGYEGSFRYGGVGRYDTGAFRRETNPVEREMEMEDELEEGSLSFQNISVKLAERPSQTFFENLPTDPTPLDLKIETEVDRGVDDVHRSNMSHPAPTEPPDSKRVKGESPLSPENFTPEVVAGLKKSYAESKPYQHAVVNGLFNDDLLQRVREEVAMKVEEDGDLGGVVQWGRKETDIYKINQSFDLASLSPEHLSQETLDKLQALQELRSALYSEEFRAWIRQVTGCGPLSGSNVDSSITCYTQGCQLLLHDDVISTRRVSWILYLPDPVAWKAEYGGALELYPVAENGVGSGVRPTKSISPRWGQFAFFEVRPGQSYHAVEEVVVGGQAKRVAISGWFHKPMKHEEGYEAPTEEAMSSLQQIRSAPPPLDLTYPELDEDALLPSTALSKQAVKFLSDYIHPQYLQRKTMAQLSEQMADNSFIVLDKFLKPDLIKSVDKFIRNEDEKDGFNRSHRQTIVTKTEKFYSIPSHDSPPSSLPSSDTQYWSLKGPSTNNRYLSLLSTSPESNPLLKLKTTLFPSPHFRHWLAIISQLLPLSHSVEVRRFRPGLDYTLARGHDDEARLDVSLGLTPHPVVGGKPDEENGWDGDESDEWGGWEVYLPPPEEGDDPAVYQSGGVKRQEALETSTTDKKEENQDVDDKMEVGEEEGDPENDEDEDNDDEDEDSGTLLELRPRFNRLTLVMRDASVLRFVKYISASAPACRWDVTGEWEVGGVMDVDDDEE